jgi:hypothetical protein
VTAAPANSTAAVPGALGNPDTVTLFGNNRVNDGLRSGFRLRTGFWLDDCQTWALEATFFYLDPASRGFSAASDGTTLSLFRPFFNTVTGQPGVEDVSNLADGIVGQVGVRTKALFLGGDLDLRRQLGQCGDGCRGCRIDLLGGYRAEGLSEDLQINENLTTLDLAGNPSGTILVQDRFRTRNLFQGAQLGLDGEVWQGRFFAGFRGLLAIGLTHQTVDVEGVTQAQAPGGAPVAQAGGLLALPTNIGHFHRDPFTFSPSLGLRVGCEWTRCLRTSVGYDFIYWSSVVRPGNQIDLVVNPNAVPPPVGPPFIPARPAFEFHGSDFWAQGLTLIVELRF